MKHINYLMLLFCMAALIACKTDRPKNQNGKNKRENQLNREKPDSIRIDKTGLYGIYRGVEFSDTGDIRHRDVAHQFSNRVAHILGKYLKAEFKAGNYLSIDFQKTKITTAGMDMKDTVVYCINMVFKKTDKCSASTGIEHCGSWGDQENYILKKRLDETIKKLAAICIGRPKTCKYVTDEKFKEYWIQFKHKDYQGDCKK
ncbi:MAG: hypothetical protein NT109_06645 [Flavobacteriia bacterium]|nr:hypothetical protein [Flavobacteriia bacterium]